tara:strand:+ start:4832 stop:5920 length:1089 start_codon:yes stop_codon:yes gene_type:complete
MILQKDELFFNVSDVETMDKIPVGNWLVMFNELNRYYLKKMEPFEIPTKIYGNFEALANRYLKTFRKYDKNLGITLTGLKGTGKSLTAKMVINKSKLPCIIVDDKYKGSEFNKFITGIKEKCVILFDEFEKKYPEEKDQVHILSLLDGTFTNKKLFIFTSNTTSNYNNFLLNRPSRIHYLKQYDRIEDKTLLDIIKHNLINLEESEELVNTVKIIDEANIDMVISLIREMNDFDESAKESIKHLNISMVKEGNYTVKFERADGIIFTRHFYSNPLHTGYIGGNYQYNDKETLKNGLSEDALEIFENEVINLNPNMKNHSIHYSLNDWELVSSNAKETIFINPKDNGEKIVIVNEIRPNYSFF